MNASRRFGNTSGASLRFEGLDPEARIGLPVGPGTTPGQLSTLLLAVLLCLCIYLPLLPFRPEEGAEPAVWSLGWVWKQLTDYKGIPVPIVAFTMWCLAFLFIKTLKIRAQRAAIGVSILPADAAFVLNATTSDAVVDRIDGIADRPDRFIYLARVAACFARCGISAGFPMSMSCWDRVPMTMTASWTAAMSWPRASSGPSPCWASSAPCWG